MRAAPGVFTPRVLLTVAVVALASRATAATHPAGLKSPPAQRSGGGLLVARAVRATTPIRIDGILDEAAWEPAARLAGFVQREPREGAPVSEETAIFVLFDDEALYFGAVLGDSAPDQITAALRGRDLWKLTGQWDSVGPDDSVAILLDTFADGRNGYYFAVNPNGAMTDALITGEGLNKNFEWDGVWRAAAQRGPEGWSVEIAIPFATLRYPEVGPDQTLSFGLNVQRVIRRKSEEAFWSPVGLSGTLWWFSRAGRLEAIRPPVRRRVVEVKPFLVADATRREATGEATSYNGQPGVDARLGVTSGLTLDLTLNTDFAQVEVDEQQVNFTRFSLFYPEKREFFLEGAGIFNFGYRDESKLFFSRRIGLDAAGQEVPLLGGAKLAGKAGRYEIGAITTRTKAHDSLSGAAQTVVRGRRQISARSSIGAMITDVRGPGMASNQVVGLDADMILFKYLTLNSFWARSSGVGSPSARTATNLYAHWDTDVFGLQYIFHDFGRDFEPALGFFPRVNIRRQSPGTRVAWRPARGPVRRYLIRTIWDWFHDQDGVQRTRHHLLHGSVTMENGDEIFVQAEHFTESPENSFVLGRDTRIPVGVYRYHRGTARYTMSPGRRYGAAVSYSWGGFYGGTREELDLRVTAKATDHFAILPTYVRNRVELPFGSFTSNLAGLRVNYNASNRLITHAFLQYNDVIQRLTLNTRLDFIYRPNSHIYLVFNEGRDTSEEAPGLPVRDRSVIVKIAHLLRR
jgi:hypothetical protein